MTSKFILNFNQIDDDELDDVGSIGLELGHFTKENIPIPDGFLLTSSSLSIFKNLNNLNQKIMHLTETINFKDPHSVSQVSKLLKKIIKESKIPNNLSLELFSAYKNLGSKLKDPRVQIKSSHKVKKHHENLSFQIFDDIIGESNLIEKIKECWASDYDEHKLLNKRQISDDFAIVVQKTLDPLRSGKIFTINPISKEKNKLIIKSMFGIFENTINLYTLPDFYEVDKFDFNKIKKDINPQRKMFKMTGKDKKVVDLPSNLRKNQELLASQINELVKIAKSIEKIKYFPQEIDWSFENGKFYVTRSRPITFIN